MAGSGATSGPGMARRDDQTGVAEHGRCCRCGRRAWRPCAATRHTSAWLGHRAARRRDLEADTAPRMTGLTRPAALRSGPGACGAVPGRGACGPGGGARRRRGPPRARPTAAPCPRIARRVSAIHERRASSPRRRCPSANGPQCTATAAAPMRMQPTAPLRTRGQRRIADAAHAAHPRRPPVPSPVRGSRPTAAGCRMGRCGSPCARQPYPTALACSRSVLQPR